MEQGGVGVVCWFSLQALKSKLLTKNRYRLDFELLKGLITLRKCTLKMGGNRLQKSFL